MLLPLIAAVIVFAEQQDGKIVTGISDFEPQNLSELLLTTTSPWYIADSIFLDTNHVSTGDIIVIGNGVLVVDDAMLTMNGTLAATGNGRITFLNGAHLHFNQFWVGQYYVFMMGNSSFEITDGMIDANGVMHYVQLHDSASYSAIRTHFPDWTFRKLFGKSSMFLEDIGHVGDFMIGDSADIHLVRCDTLMPWFQALDGSVIDVEFPEPNFVEHFEVGAGVPGFSGMGYHFTVDSCSRCWWSLETFTGCSVTIHNSEIRGSCIRLKGDDTTIVYGIRNYGMHDAIMPLDDRHLEYDNTYVYWWNWYPLDNTALFMDSCVFGEMIPKQRGRAFVTRSTHDGATIMLGTQDSSYMSFSDGISQAYLSTFRRSTMLLENVRVTPLWPYQALNIAHDYSELICINCDFDSLPFALDTAVVFYAAIDSLDTLDIGDMVAIQGHAWLSVGPLYPYHFDGYALRCSSHVDHSVDLISESGAEVHDDNLGIWNTEGLSEGNYTLSLAVRNSNTDSVIATMEIYLTTMAIGEKSVTPGDLSILIRPNPFNCSCRLEWGEYSPVEIEFYDIRGKLIFKITPDRELKSVRWTPPSNLSSGIYLARFEFNDTSVTKRILFLK